MCTLFPPLIYFLVKFREDEGDEEQEELQKRLSSKKKKKLAATKSIVSREFLHSFVSNTEFYFILCSSRYILSLSRV